MCSNVQSINLVVNQEKAPEELPWNRILLVNNHYGKAWKLNSDMTDEFQFLAFQA